MERGEEKATGQMDSPRTNSDLLSTSGHWDGDEDSVFHKIGGAVTDACSFLRLSASRAAHSLSEIGSRHHTHSSSYSDQGTKRAPPNPGRLDSEVRSVDNGTNYRRPGTLGRLSSVSVGDLPSQSHNGESTASSVRRAASSAFSSVKSLFSRDQIIASSDSEEKLVELARQYTQGQTNGNVEWTIRLAENPKKFIDHNRYRKIKFASSTTFLIKYNGSNETLYVNFHGKEDFLESIKNHPDAHITLKLSLAPGRRRRRACLQKHATRYLQNNTHFHGVSATDLGGKTLSLAVVSRRKPWKKSTTLWERSVSLERLSVTNVMEVYWGE